MKKLKSSFEQGFKHAESFFPLFTEARINPTILLSPLFSVSHIWKIVRQEGSHFEKEII